MVRNYQRKSNKVQWTDGQMQFAIDAVRAVKSVNDSALKFDIPRSTLQNKLNDLQNGKLSSGSYKKDAGFKRTFNDEQEVALYQYIIQMEKRLMGYTSVEIRHLAYDFANKLGIPNNFNAEKKAAGKDWLHNFMSRYKLSFRVAQHTSRARANSFNEQNVQAFYSLLQDLYIQYNFQAEQIYNVDETGFSVNPKSGFKIVARQGRKQVGGLTAAERGQTVTAEICMSASGLFMPPMLIFPRVKHNDEYLVGKPPGAWAEFHKNGWITEDLFTKWFTKFIEFSKPTQEKPVLLLLDSHSSHVKNLKVIDLANKNNVIIACFPPHCTHRLQPLDVGFMKPLSQNYSELVNKLQRKEKMNIKRIFAVFGTAFLNAAKPKTAISAFAATGIYPLNLSTFSKSDFANNDEKLQNTLDKNVSDVEVDKYVSIIKHIESSNSSDIDILHNIDQSVPTSNNEEFSKDDIQKENTPNSANNSQELISYSNHTQQIHSDYSELHEIKIPVRYIIEAKPLINILNQSLSSLAKATSPLSILPISNGLPLKELSTPRDVASSLDISLPTPLSTSNVQEINVNATPTNTLQSTFEPTSIPLTVGINDSTYTLNKDVERTQPEVCEIVKKRRTGKTAVVTSEAYKAELIAQKIKTMKKEPVEKKKQRSQPKKVPLPDDSLVPKTVKKRRAAVNKKPPTKTKIAYLESPNQFENVPSIPQQNIIYQLPLDGYNNNPILIQSLGNNLDFSTENNGLVFHSSDLPFEFFHLPGIDI